ncbi:MAG: Rne/Rng family ribonuclease [Streptosporangiales bacterium]|nr:Rne/Rng family ribonuclease [Streptosporangiales bacterium]
MLEDDAPGGDNDVVGQPAEVNSADGVTEQDTAEQAPAAKKTAERAVAKKTAKKTARKRATKKAAAAPPDGDPAAAAMSDQTGDQPEAPTASSDPSHAEAGTPAAGGNGAQPSTSAADESAGARSGRRGARAKAADVDELAAATSGGNGAQPSTSAADEPAVTSSASDESAGARSGRRGAQAKASDSGEPATRSRRRGAQAGRSGAKTDAADEAAAAEAEPAAGSRVRRGSASRPPGPPEPAEDPRTAVFLPPRPVDPPAAREDDVPDAGDEADEAEPDTASVTEATEADDADDADGEADDDEDRPRRRRRRGGRGRRRRTGQRETAGQDDDSDDDSDDDTDDEADGTDGESETAAEDGGGDQDESRSSRRRRRRRRRSSGGGGEAAPSPDDPPNTVVKVRQPREQNPGDEVTALKGSTRLEAKRQRRRDGRDPGRRRAPVLSESEFLARREAVDRVMVVRQVEDRTQIAICEDGVLVEHYVERGAAQSYVGNVYLGRVQNVLPSMEAAFIDIGRGRNAVLYAGEVNFAGVELGNQPKRIESVLKSGQSVLVQVTKGPVGQKGARLTSQIGLPGRYLVYSPEGSTAGISRKLPDKERDRLKQVLKQALPDEGGVIVRTAAEGASEEELGRDVSRLVAQWETIQQKAKSANAPALLYEEPDLTVRVIRDAFNEDFSKLVVAGEESWEMIEPYVQHVAPHLADRVERWTDSKDVFAAYRIDEQLAKALDRKVFLPSGGSLVVDRTEAMTVIDVNTGKFTGQGGNLEETVTRNNLEAAEEIVRQLRLRDIGGIVVVDFIDMVLESNRDLVLRRLVECLARDRTRHQVAEVTSLGLVQMTRKRIGQGLLEAFSKPCDCCDGRGLHVSLEPVEPERSSGSGSGGGGGGGRGKGKQGGGSSGKGKKQNQNQQKNRDSAEKIAAIAAASG